jgi:hypothetical protein
VAFTENLAAFFDTADFAVTATSGAQTVQVVFDAPDQEILGGSVLSREYAITYAATQLTGLTTGSAITVDGVGYAVREVTAQDDGKIMRATLRKP